MLSVVAFCITKISATLYSEHNGKYTDCVQGNSHSINTTFFFHFISFHLYKMYDVAMHAA